MQSRSQATFTATKRKGQVTIRPRFNATHLSTRAHNSPRTRLRRPCAISRVCNYQHLQLASRAAPIVLPVSDSVARWLPNERWWRRERRPARDGKRSVAEQSLSGTSDPLFNSSPERSSTITTFTHCKAPVQDGDGEDCGGGVGDKGFFFFFFKFRHGQPYLDKAVRPLKPVIRKARAVLTRSQCNMWMSAG